jgi:hypothetical protein
MRSATAPALSVCVSLLSMHFGACIFSQLSKLDQRQRRVASHDASRPPPAPPRARAGFPGGRLLVCWLAWQVVSASSRKPCPLHSALACAGTEKALRTEG